MGCAKVIVVLVAICVCSIDHVRPEKENGIIGLSHFPGVRPFFLDKGAELGTLKLVIVLHRSGDRTYLRGESYPKDPNKNIVIGPKGKAQLTAIGKAQTHGLGRYLRERYNGYLKPVYSIDEVVARASDTDRSIMSAQTVLAGLFPPSYDDPEGAWNPNIHWQPIPVHVIDKNVDNILLQMGPCPRYADEVKAVEASDIYKNFDKKHEHFYVYLSQHSGLSIRNADEAVHLIIVLRTQIAHGLKLPPWTDEPGFWITAKEVLKVAFEQGIYSTTEKRLRAGPLVTETINYLERKRNETENPGHVKYPLAKLLLFSVHHYSIVSWLVGLGITDWEVPQFASAVLLELHKDDSHPALQHHHRFSSPQTDAYSVRLFYRNDTTAPLHEFKIPKCGSPCRLSELTQLVSNFIITPEQWTKECNGAPVARNDPTGFGAYGK